MTDDRQMDETQPDQTSTATSTDKPITEGDGANFGNTKVVADPDAQGDDPHKAENAAKAGRDDMDTDAGQE